MLTGTMRHDFVSSLQIPLLTKLRLQPRGRFGVALPPRVDTSWAAPTLYWPWPSVPIDGLVRYRSTSDVQTLGPSNRRRPANPAPGPSSHSVRTACIAGSNAATVTADPILLILVRGGISVKLFAFGKLRQFGSLLQPLPASTDCAGRIGTFVSRCDDNSPPPNRLQVLEFPANCRQSWTLRKLPLSGSPPAPLRG